MSSRVKPAQTSPYRPPGVLAVSDAISQEKINLNLLRQTNEKLEESIELLENQLACVEEEDNEWKTRYLVQKELNDYYKRAFFICDEQIPKAKGIQRIVNRATRRGSRLPRNMETGEETVTEIESYRHYIQKLCQELESRIEEEGKAYYWATEIRKRALIELNYTYVPAPVSKPNADKVKNNEADLDAKYQKPVRVMNPKYGLTKSTGNVRKLPPMHF